MRLSVKWIEVKTIPSGAKLLEGTFTGEDGKDFEATIWEKDKEGKYFPDFATLAAGQSFEVNPWTNPKTGKVSIYAPRPQNAPQGNFKPKTGVIAQAQNHKAELIAEAQDNKERGIKMSSTIRMAVDCAVAEGNVTEANIKKWRSWFYTNWDVDPSQEAPF